MTIKIIPIPALQDNLIWLCVDEASKTAWAVDPGEAAPVISQLQCDGLALAGILITHHHGDHTAGIPELLQYAGNIRPLRKLPILDSGKAQFERVPEFTWVNEDASENCNAASIQNRQLPKRSIPVFGSHNSPNPWISQRLTSQDTIHCAGCAWQVIAIPGHTLDHIAYHGNGNLFCGDTLFSAGCGRVFEGTPTMLYDSLQTLARLPDQTAIYCGHEYTVANLRFAQHVEPDNQAISQQLAIANRLRTQGECTLPSQLGTEKTINPFLRCHVPTVIDVAEHYAQKKLDSPGEVFAALREWKNNFAERL